VILAAESTVRAAGQGVRTGKTDEIKVKGKAEPIRVYEIVDLAD
jgi:class 3 adenylate cyclase